jgi:hypothetical protein
LKRFARFDVSLAFAGLRRAEAWTDYGDDHSAELPWLETATDTIFLPQNIGSIV